MVGKYSFTVSDSTISYRITLNRNITVLRGNGGSGKTRLYTFIQEAQKKGTGVHLTDTICKVVAASDDFLEVDLQKYKGTNTIFIFDENSACLSSTEFREAITLTGCYFLIISRNNYSSFSVSVKEIYELECNKDLNRLIYTLKPCFPDTLYGKMEGKLRLLTEDSRAGCQLFSRMLPEKDESGEKYVVSAKGKSNVTGSIKQNPNRIVIVDGAAFGFEMQDAIAAMIQNNCAIIAKESFEYCILKSGIIAVPEDIDLESPNVDYTKFLTWENYYTALLEDLTKGSRMLYDKNHLNSNYSTFSNAAKIIAVYIQDVKTPVVGTSYFL